MMSDAVKILFTFAVILILLRKKLNIGYVMMIASVVLFLLYFMDIAGILNTLRKTAMSNITIKLLLALSLIRMFELILREKMSLRK